MIILLLLVIALVLIVHTFVQSAVVLLPWTLSAGCIAGTVAVILGKQIAQKDPWRDIAVWFVFGASAVGTVAFGYLGWLVSPPQIVEEATTNGWEWLFKLPDVKMEDLWSMFPVHLSIVGLLAAAIATMVFQRLNRSDEGIQFIDGKL